MGPALGRGGRKGHGGPIRRVCLGIQNIGRRKGAVQACRGSLEHCRGFYLRKQGLLDADCPVEGLFLAAAAPEPSVAVPIVVDAAVSASGAKPSKDWNFVVSLLGLITFV